jgi:predicted nucleic acid-binding protein
VLVLDASVAVDLCVARVGDASHAALGDDELVAPPLLWSEVPSVLHELRSRGEISEDLAGGALARLTENVIGIREVRPENLTKTARDIAHRWVGQRHMTPNISRRPSSSAVVS